MNSNQAQRLRRARVLALVALGQSNDEIAARLGLRLGHVENIIAAARAEAAPKQSLLERCGLSRERVTNFFAGGAA